MAERRGPRRAAAAAVALALVLAPVGLVRAAPSPDDYPSWEEVEQARSDEAAAAREAARLEGLLSQLESEAVLLGREAQLRAEESFLAQQELEAATARAGALAQSADAAEQRAAASARLAARALVELSRAGGGDPALALLVSSRREADELLEALAGAARLGEASQGWLDQAVADRNAADAVSAEAAVAEQLRAAAADAAERSAQEAERAVGEAAARAAARQADLDRMYEQLALLRGTTAELEREFREGQEAQEPDPAPEPGPSDPGSGSGGGGSGEGSGSGSGGGSEGSGDGSGGSGGSGGDSGGSGSPAPDSGKAAGAIAYAKAQLGEPYVYAGAGPNGWDCSGLTMQSYASVGVAIGGHGSTSQYNYLKSKGRLVPVSERQAGDLLFYSDGGSTSATKYHVAIYLGGGKMIEAPYPGQVVRITAVRSFDLVPYAGRPTTS